MRHRLVSLVGKFSARPRIGDVASTSRRSRTTSFVASCFGFDVSVFGFMTNCEVDDGDTVWVMDTILPRSAQGLSKTPKSVQLYCTLLDCLHHSRYLVNDGSTARQ